MKQPEHLLVIDAQGGGIGNRLIVKLKEAFPQMDITAVGANHIATMAMKKAGADQVATGENAVIVACRHADIILGPIGIIIADALLGEISPAMAAAVCQSRAKRILIPCNQCDNIIAGVTGLNMSALIQSAVEELRAICKKS